MRPTTSSTSEKRASRARNRQGPCKKMGMAPSHSSKTENKSTPQTQNMRGQDTASRKDSEKKSAEQKGAKPRKVKAAVKQSDKRTEGKGPRDKSRDKWATFREAFEGTNPEHRVQYFSDKRE